MSGEQTAVTAPLQLPPWHIEPRRDVILRDGSTATLRPLVSADAARMAALFAALSERDIYYFFRLPEAEARRLALDVERDAAYRLIAVDGHRADTPVLGYTFLQWQEGSAPVFGLALRSEAQSRGLGRALLEHLLSTAAASGVGLVRLTVHPDNGRALRLYQRAGFRLVGEFINRHQGVKQYRMEADLQETPPAILEGLTIVPVGALGVGLAAARVQQAILDQAGALPLVLDRSAPPDQCTIFVADLSATAAAPGLAGAPGGPDPIGNGWIVSLDRRHLLIAGSDAPAVERAVRRYVDWMRERSSVASGADALACMHIAGLALSGL